MQNVWGDDRQDGWTHQKINKWSTQEDLRDRWAQIGVGEDRPTEGQDKLSGKIV